MTRLTDSVKGTRQVGNVSMRLPAADEDNGLIRELELAAAEDCRPEEISDLLVELFSELEPSSPSGS